MKYLKKFRKTILFLLKSLIVLSLLGILIYFWRRYYPDTYLNNGNYVIMFTYLFAFITFTSLYGGFKIGIRRVTETVYSMMLGAVFSDVFVYGELCLVVRRGLSPLPMLVALFADFIVILCMVFISNKIYHVLYSTKHILAVFDTNGKDVEIIRKIGGMKDRYRIQSAISVRKGLDAIKAAIDENESVLIGDFDRSLRDEVFQYAYSRGKRIYLLPSIADMLINGNELIQISDSTVLYCKNSGFTLEQRIVKRAMDIIVSLLLLAVTSPIMLVCALAVKLCDGGPVFYRQERLTRAGKVFKVIKFRSMIPNAETASGAVLSSERDSRITPVGRVIRAVRLDELPQLINVLKGDMTLVGPRPERPELAEENCREIPEFSYRLKVKAGLTGYAQVFGKYNTTPREKLKMDIYYIEKHSLLLDLKILFYTLKILFMRESTEGVKPTEKQKQEG